MSRTRTGHRVIFSIASHYCPECRRRYMAYVRTECCGKCEAKRNRLRPAPSIAIISDAGRDREAIHRAAFMGCKVALRIRALGIAYRWSPEPQRALSPYWQQRVRSDFASWQQRWVRAFAAERGLDVRAVRLEPDLIEPCEAIR